MAQPARTLSLIGEIFTHRLAFASDLTPLTPAISGDWCVAPGGGKDAARATLIEVKSGGRRAEIVLERAVTMAVRLQKEVLCVGDDRGRLLVMELRGGQLLRNMRV